MSFADEMNEIAKAQVFTQKVVREHNELTVALRDLTLRFGILGVKEWDAARNLLIKLGKLNVEDASQRPS